MNLEEGYPIVAEALDLAKSSIIEINKGAIVVFIHGYGSSGKGGEIRKAVRSWLKSEESKKRFRTVIYGEEFEMFNFKAIELKDKDHDLVKYYGKYNHGITVVYK